MKTSIIVDDEKKFNKLIKSVDCDKMLGYSGKVKILLKTGEKLSYTRIHKKNTYLNEFGFVFEISENIFDRLNEVGVCYAVGVTDIRFKSAGVDMISKDYFIIANKCDYINVSIIDSSFKNSANKKYLTIERTLKDTEIEVFKSIQNDFIKVVHDENGRIYELKNNSFKKSHDNARVDKTAP